MDNKTQIVAMLKEDFERWQKLLGRLEESEIVEPQLPGNRSIKDVVIHLWGWQQRSIARMEAALTGREPEFPDWPEGLDPEAESDVDAVNDWLYETYREQPWPEVYRRWRDGYQQFIKLAGAVPEADLLAEDRYTWLEGHPLSLVLTASYDHHDEHIDTLLIWLWQYGIEVY